ncbi:redoxin domain-containing protein [Paenibacillus sp. J5C_2022]|uniref:redoxin domain-containing protein n=1 Tax=Paenibacillus sp. J5C2022 TaxID=2977129 RepID=UPI0021D019D3|nr:redoxin domain-containing protein [Paenibacillus sp. J5C2022]MCU6712006.1 redoxin domain-containing protein [Paenibacillus sp. J5C2022]
MKAKRRQWLQWSIFLALAAICAWVVFKGEATPEPPAIGDLAPDFTLNTWDGGSVKLQDYGERKQPVLINFWASWCTPCVNELPMMNEAYKLNEDVEVLAVNVGESGEKVNRFMQRYELTFPVLLDGQQEVKKRYGVTGLPLSLLLDGDGRIVDIVSGEMTFDEITALLRSAP